MPRASKNTPPVDANGKDVDPNLIYVCGTTGTALAEGVEHSFNYGQRLRGDHPLVRALPGYFTRDGDPAASVWDEVVRRNEADRPPVEFELTLAGALPTPLEREDTVALTRQLTVRGGYSAGLEVVTYDRGTVFAAREEIVSLLPPGSFEQSPLQFTRGK